MLPASTPATTNPRTGRIRRLAKVFTTSPSPLLSAVLAILAVLASSGCGSEPARAQTPDRASLVHVHDSGEGHGSAHPVALTSEAPLPGASLYHLDAAWTDHRGDGLALGDLRGRPVIVVMMYASCDTACPILIRDALRVDASLSQEVRAETRVLIVTFDTENDAPEQLAAYVEENGLEDPRWRFAVGDAMGTRALAAMLGVRYRPASNGMCSHSNLITVLGPDGVPVARVEGLGQPAASLVAAIEGSLR